MKTKLQHLALAYTLLLFFLGSNQSMATHIIGTDFSYKCTSNPGFYEVSAKFHRDCFGIPMCSNCPGSILGCQIQLLVGGTGAFEGITYGSISLYIDPTVPVSDPFNLCSSAASVCTNCGTRTAGTFTPGSEVYTYKGIVNLSSLPSALCNVRLSFNTCCRNNNISSITSPGSVSFFSEFYINRCISPCNSSPALSENPVIVMCAGVDQSINLSNEDPNGDSLSYHLAPSLEGTNFPVPYATPYNQNVPFAYLGAPSQMALPGGIHLSPTTGDLMYRPIGSFVSNLVVETKQWTKVNNVITLAGSIRKDYQIYSKICTANSPINFLKYDTLGAYQGAIGYTQDTAIIVQGQKFCRTFVASDSVQTDTTDFKWTLPTGMLGASVTRLFNLATRNVNGPRQDSVRFCWTPSLSNVRSLPYVFTLRANDRACPMPASATRSLAIFVIQDPNKLRITNLLVTHPKCHNTAKGMVVINATNGGSPIQYKLNNGVFGSGNIFQNLSAGQKVFIVKDSNDCGDTLGVSISEPSLPLIGTFSLINPKCFGLTGTISVNATGGLIPYQYSIDSGANYTSNKVFTNVPAKQYQYRVRDANNCVKIYDLTLLSPSQISVSAIPTMVTCFGGNNGTLQLNASGGTPPYLYAKSNGNPFQSSNIFYNLAAGLYTPQIKDANNCQVAKPSSIIGPATAITTSISHKDESCLGAKNAWALCSASGGAAPYSFTWLSTPPQLFEKAINLGSGKILVSVKDSFKCTVKDSVQIGFREIYQGENICKVSTDTVLGTHQIIWNKAIDQGISSYKILGSSSPSGGFTAIGNVSILSEPIFVDTDVSRLNKTYYYQIKAVDSCNHESNVVGTHSNAFLSGLKVNVKNELNWVLPMGASGIQNIVVWRSNGSMPYAQITNLPSTATQYSDTIMPVADSSSYVVEFEQTPQCQLQNGVYAKFYSNVIRLEGLPAIGLRENLSNSHFAIYPNPSSGIFSISSKQPGKSIKQVEIYNALGAKVYSNFYTEKNNGNSLLGKSQIEINLSDLAAGIYYLEIFSQDNIKSSHKITLTH